MLKNVYKIKEATGQLIHLVGFEINSPYLSKTEFSLFL